MERFLILGVDDGALAEALANETCNRPLYGFAKNYTDDPPKPTWPLDTPSGKRTTRR